MPAADLETLVENKIRALLKQPTAILEFAGTNTIAARKVLIERAADLARYWPELSASERHRIVGACLFQIAIKTEAVVFVLRPLLHFRSGQPLRILSSVDTLKTR